METFVREALARAAYERSDAEGGLGGQFLEVRESYTVRMGVDSADEFAALRLRTLGS